MPDVHKLKIPMTRFNRRSRRTAGNVALIFALAAIPAVTILAAGIELTRVNNAKAKLDRATDAAALTAKKVQMDARRLGSDKAKFDGVAAGRKSFALNTEALNEAISDREVAISWDGDESARALGSGNAKLIFGGLLGIRSIRITSLAVASSGGDGYFEIALVLDNTASMFNTDGRSKTRFTHLREAATSFVNAAFNNMGKPDRLRFSVVPFATTVNIASENPLDWDASAGSSGSVADYGSRSMPTSTLNRNGEIRQNTQELARLYAPVQWRGCLSGHDESLSANDTAKSDMKWDVAMVPHYPQQNIWRPSIPVPNACVPCTGTPQSYPTDPGPGNSDSTPGKQGNMLDRSRKDQFASVTLKAPVSGQNQFASFGTRYQTVQGTSCTIVSCQSLSCDPSGAPVGGANCVQDTKKYSGSDPYTEGRRNAFISETTSCIDNPYNACTAAIKMGTLLPCISDPNEFAWNNAGGRWCPWVPASNWTKFDDVVGPNINCSMPMLGLSGSRPQILRTINLMSPVVGGTHNDVGLRWGLRTLSPRVQWANFFGNNGSRRPSDFSTNNSKKAMVLITDGENERAEDFPGFWGCSDRSMPGCNGTPSSAELDNRMLSWCSAIRDTYNVKLYTVAVNITNPAAVARLATCAGDPSRAFAVDAVDLNKTLESVAGSIFQLRLKE